MKTVGILTFHYVNNHGAVLQAYALRKTLNTFSDCHAEIINYVPERYLWRLPAGSSVADMEKQREKFNRFLSVHCGVRTPMIRRVSGNAYDVYVVGSDMVWSPDFSWGAHEYFLPNLDHQAKRIAYSASIGTEFERIDRAYCQRYLPRFDAISMREKSYVGLISELAGKKCEDTLDPAMLLDRSHYELLVENPDVEPDPYVLYLWYERKDRGLQGIGTANALARKYGLTVKHTFLSETSSVRQMLAKDGGCMLPCGIGEFLWYMKNAHVVVTNSFHGGIFSILFGRPFYICCQEWGCRQENLVELFHLEDRVMRGYLSPDKLNLEMDYGPVLRILEKERERSLSYLGQAIGG